MPNGSSKLSVFCKLASVRSKYNDPISHPIPFPVKFASISLKPTDKIWVGMWRRPCAHRNVYFKIFIGLLLCRSCNCITRERVSKYLLNKCNKICGAGDDVMVSSTFVCTSTALQLFRQCIVTVSRCVLSQSTWEVNQQLCGTQK